MVDADGSTDGSKVTRFGGAILSGTDFAKGSRFAVGGNSEDITIIRRWRQALPTSSIWKLCTPTMTLFQLTLC